MRQKYLGFSLLFLLLAAGPAAAELKIAVLDTQRALLESEEAQQLLKRAQEELQSEENEVKSLGEEIVALQEQLQKDAEVLSHEAFAGDQYVMRVSAPGCAAAMYSKRPTSSRSFSISSRSTGSPTSRPGGGVTTSSS